MQEVGRKCENCRFFDTGTFRTNDGNVKATKQECGLKNEMTEETLAHGCGEHEFSDVLIDFGVVSER